jgi:exosortase
MTRASRHVLFGAFTLTLLGVHVGAVRRVIELSLHDATASHLVFVPFMTLALLYNRRDLLFTAEPPGLAAASWNLGGLIGLSWVAGALAPAAGPVYALTLVAAAMATAWVAGFAACYGALSFRAGLFPLLFLGFAIPIPSTFVDVAVLLLKSGSARVVAALFSLTGMPFHRSGYVFALPALRIEIADQCSGIRSSLALVMTAVLAGQLFLTTTWKRVLVVLVAVPFAVVKNGFRIVALSLLATYVDPGFMTGALHHEGGIVFFTIGLAVLAPFFLALSRSEPALTREHSS